MRNSSVLAEEASNHGIHKAYSSPGASVVDSSYDFRSLGEYHSQTTIVKKQSPQVPVDEGGTVMVIQFLYGFSMLLTFNVILSCLDYFVLKMPGYQPLSTYPFAMNSSLLIGGLLFTFYGHLVSYSNVIVVSFVGQALLMLVIPFAGDVGGATAYWLCFAILFVYGLFSGVCQATCYSYNAKLPASYIAIFLTSHGLAGIASNILRLTSLWIWPVAKIEVGASEVDTSSAFKSCLFMQLSGISIVLLCIPAQLILNKNDFANYYFGDRKLERADQVDQIDGEGSQTRDLANDGFIRDSSEEPESNFQLFLKQCRAAFRSTKGMLTALCYIFLLTFVCFPGLAAASPLNFLEGKPGALAWTTLVLLTAFNVMDTLGRYLAGLACLNLSRTKTLFLTYMRTLQLGLFICTAFEVSPVWLFGSDAFKLVNFAIFAFSNGYLSSLCSIGAPEVVKTREERGNVGAFIGVTKLLGILIGSLLAVPLKELIKLTPAYAETATV